MNQDRTSGAVCYLCCLAAMLFAGCGSGGDTVRISGQLLKDGKPYRATLTSAEPETFSVDFLGAVNGTQFVFPASMTESGAFRVEGPEGRGIPRGQYRITVLHSGFLGAGGDRLQTRFAADKTPLNVELTDNSELTIDLGAGTVMK